MQTSLESLRSQHNPGRTAEYQKEIAQCPPISKLLLAHLRKMFSRPTLKPTKDTMAQELIYQHGIDKVLDYLETVNERQENEIRKERVKDSTVQHKV